MTAGLPQVSVVIPTYNRAWILGDAVDSALAQAGVGFEVIVVDDGSTDGTAGMLAAYRERIRVLRQPNQGVSAARNLGLRAARGDLIAFLDSDDCWRPGKLAAQVSFFGAHPDALIHQTQESWVRRGRPVNPGRRHCKPDGMIFEPSLELCLVSPSAVMVRRAIFDLVGRFDERLPACEDYDLWLRVSCRYPVHLGAEPLTVKRGGHPDQLSCAPGLDRYRIASIVNLLASGWLDAGQRRAAVAVLRRKCAVYAGGCRKRGRVSEAERYEGLMGMS